MKNKKVKLNRTDLPYNYSLYPVEELPVEEIVDKSQAIPTEYCKKYKAKIFVRQSYKTIIEF